MIDSDLNIFYRRSRAIVFVTVPFDTFWKLWELFFLKKTFSKSSQIYVCFIRKNSNSDNSKMVIRRKVPYPSVNITFHVLSIGLWYTLLFKWSDFGLECLATITPKGQSFKLKASVWNFPIPETGRNCNSLFKLVDSNWVVIMEEKRKIEYSWARTFRGRQSFSVHGTLSLA